MQINKQNINVGKAVFEDVIKSGAEGSIIVPDVKPDILKVLQVDAETFLTEKTVDDGKIILKGDVCINVLYIPEADNEQIQCINGVFEFCETVKNVNFEHGMSITAFCDAEKVGYKLINSRKIGFEAQIVIDVCVTHNEEIPCVCEIEYECAEVIKDSFCVKEATSIKEFAFKIDEILDLPCDDAKEILKSTVKISEKDYKTITGKVVVKGKAGLAVLYKTEGGRCEHIDIEIPFTEVFDAEYVEEDCQCEIIYEIKKTEIKIVNDNAENKKRISAYIEVVAAVCKENTNYVEYIKDCYFTDSICDISFGEIECEEVLEKPMLSVMLRQIVEKKENAPDIARIYTSVAKPVITATDVQNGRIAVSGMVTSYILYTSDDYQNPVASICEEIPFSYMIDCAKAGHNTDVFLKVECEHVSCTLNSANAVELRCGLCIKGKVIKKSKLQIMSDIFVEKTEDKDTAMTVYFVKNGDTVWDIGKKYHVKCEDICQCNQKNKEDSLVVGEKIIIPVTK